MNSKEIALQAMARGYPARVPISYCNRDFQSSDTITFAYGKAADFVETEPGLTEWGYVWKKIDATMGQPVKEPLADWQQISAYRPPDPWAPGRLDAVAAQAAQYLGKFFLIDMGITGSNVAMFLRGFENFIMDLTLERDRAEQVLDIVFGFENGLIQRLAGGPVDGLRFCDDWGMQRGLIISPRVWREAFFPRYKAQFDLVHRAGMKVWFHTCGNVFEIIGDLIEAGADVLELLQPDVMGVERLADAFGGKVCFACSIDHQRRAISGSHDEIFRYARLLQEQLGGANGAFIGFIEDYSCLGMDEEHFQWIRQAFHGLPLYAWATAAQAI